VGIDEVAWRRGHDYLTLVYQIDGHCQRLLWVGNDQTVKILPRFGSELTLEYNLSSPLEFTSWGKGC